MAFPFKPEDFKAAYERHPEIGLGHFWFSSSARSGLVGTCCPLGILAYEKDPRHPPEFGGQIASRFDMKAAQV